MDDYREPVGSKSEKLLESLKERIMNPQTKGKVLIEPGKEEFKTLPYYTYPCSWNNDFKRIIDLESFGNQVYADIMDSIEKEFGKIINEPLNEFEDEKSAMEIFIEEKTENYVIGTRINIINELYTFVNGEKYKNYSFLFGDSGSGKTALLAKFYQEYSNYDENIYKLVIPHFIGITTKSTDIRQILRRFCYELSKNIDFNEEIPEEYDELIKTFHSLLYKASNFKPIIIIIDAINQLNLSNHGTDFRWLPNELPKNVHIIISSLPGSILETLKKKAIFL